MKKNLILILILIILFVLTSGCSGPKYEPQIKYALDKAKENKYEILKALEYYCVEKGSDEDSLRVQKLEAVKFLVSNMVNKYYLSGVAIDEFNVFIDSVYATNQIEYDISTIHEKFNQNSRYQSVPLSFNADLEKLSFDFIINHIEESFKVWKTDRSKHLSFADFCEYILPYRLSNEEPQYWMKEYNQKFEYLLNRDSGTVVKACSIVNEKLKLLPPHIAKSSVNKAAIRPLSLINIKFGLCDDYSIFTTYTMRSLGIPVSLAVIPYWGQGNGAHSFNILLTENNDIIDFSGAEDNLGEHFNRFNGYTKVFRKTFGLQTESLAMIHEGEIIPPFFRDPCLIDITDKFPFIECKNVSIKLPEDYSAINKFVYICVFSPSGWKPVDWSKIKDRTVVFKNIGPNVVYQLAYYADDTTKPIGYPFILDSLGHISYITPSHNTSSLMLERKNQNSKSLELIPASIVGGQFQGANSPDFSDVEILYKISKIPSFKYTTIDVSSGKSFKYFRYMSSKNTQGNIAEIEI